MKTRMSTLYLYHTSILEEKVLPSLRPYCSLHDRPIIKRQVVGARNMTLFGKPADREDGGLVPQRTILPELEFRLLLH